MGDHQTAAMAKIALLLMLAAIVIATQASWNEYELAELNARRISEGARYAQVDASGSGWSEELGESANTTNTTSNSDYYTSTNCNNSNMSSNSTPNCSLSAAGPTNAPSVVPSIAPTSGSSSGSGSGSGSATNEAP